MNSRAYEASRTYARYQSRNAAAHREHPPPQPPTQLGELRPRLHPLVHRRPLVWRVHLAEFPAGGLHGAPPASTPRAPLVRASSRHSTTQRDGGCAQVCPRIDAAAEQGGNPQVERLRQSDPVLGEAEPLGGVQAQEDVRRRPPGPRPGHPADQHHHQERGGHASRSRARWSSSPSKPGRQPREQAQQRREPSTGPRRPAHRRPRRAP